MIKRARKGHLTEHRRALTSPADFSLWAAPAVRKFVFNGQRLSELL